MDWTLPAHLHKIARRTIVTVQLVARAKAFAEKLEFTADVKGLGITEGQAKAFGIGVHRGHVYCAMRYESGTVAGFLHVAAGKLMLPKSLLPDQPRRFCFRNAHSSLSLALDTRGFFFSALLTYCHRAWAPYDTKYTS